jgi:mRNA-degrading endonuclease RelE of RelBE toxin-antitoxin system
MSHSKSSNRAWGVVLAKEAEKQFKKLPADRKQLILKHLKLMRADPFQGDVKALKGDEWKGRYRSRVGRYRIIFRPLMAEQIVHILLILPRTEKTYR